MWTSGGELSLSDEYDQGLFEQLNVFLPTSISCFTLSTWYVGRSVKLSNLELCSLVKGIEYVEPPQRIEIYIALDFQA